MFSFDQFESPRQVRLTRRGFWLIGLVSGAVMLYTGRFFINSDAMIYLEMAEAFRAGELSGLVNYTFSPLYPILLSLAQAVLNPPPSEELVVMKVVGYFGFVAAMFSCDVFVSTVLGGLPRETHEKGRTLPAGAFMCLSYGMFLTASLVLIRIRLMNPDMLVLAAALACATVIERIRQGHAGHLDYASLGMFAGLGYLAKAFFMLYSAALAIVSAMVGADFRKSVSRALLAAVVMAAVSAPLVAALSLGKGGFTYGEGGRHIFAVDIGGEGEPVRKPEQIHSNPRVAVYRLDLPFTLPHAHDCCYWTIGLRPKLELTTYAGFIAGNLVAIFTQMPWLGFVVLWGALQPKFGFVRFGPVVPLSCASALILQGLAGLGLFSLIRMEPRYVAPFLLLAFVGFLSGLRYKVTDSKTESPILVGVVVLTTLFAGILVHSMIDQSLRGLCFYENKPSYKEAYIEHGMVSTYLTDVGLQPGDPVVVLGDFPTNWGRMAGVKIIGRFEDPQEFFSANRERRKEALEAIGNAGFKAVVGKGNGFKDAKDEGWKLVPGTRDYYVLLPGRDGKLRGGPSEP
ncbi:MAG: hypothetical protein V2B18_15740 [Pseudomonadota bacterium]